MPEQPNRYVIRNGLLVPEAVQQELDRHMQLIDVLQADSKSDESRLSALETRRTFFWAYLNVAIASYYPAAGTYTKIPTDTFGTGTFGPHGWSTVTDDMVVGADQEGLWLFTASCLENEALAAGNACSMSLFANGGEFQRMAFTRAVTATNLTMSGAALAWLQSGWTVDVRASVSSGAAKTAGAGYQYQFVAGTRLGA